MLSMSLPTIMFVDAIGKVIDGLSLGVLLLLLDVDVPNRATVPLINATALDVIVAMLAKERAESVS